MKKLLILALLISCTYAADKGGIFVGVGYLQGGDTTTSKPTSGAQSEAKNDIKGYSISYGIRTDSNNRLEISYERDKLENKTTKKTDEIMSFNINFDITIDKLSFGRVTPYIGFGGGRCEYMKNSSNTIDGKNANGYIIGYSTGFLIDVSKYVDLEIAYKNKKMSWMNVANGDLEDEYRVGYVGLNFRF